MVLAESAQLKLSRLYEKTLYKPGTAVVSVARPRGVTNPDGTFTVAKFGGEPLRDTSLLRWCAEVIETLSS